MRDYERGELAKDILLAIVAGGVALGVALTLATFPGLGYIFKLFGAKTSKEKDRIRQSIRGLERHGYLQVYKKNEAEYIKITPLGEQMMIQRSIILTRPKQPEKWDGLWRLVMFDIPENRRKARNALTLRAVSAPIVLCNAIFVIRDAISRQKPWRSLSGVP